MVEAFVRQPGLRYRREDAMTPPSEMQPPPFAALHPAAAPAATPEGLALLAFARRYPVGCAGAATLALVVLLAIAAPLVTAYDPNQVKLRERKALGFLGVGIPPPTPTWGNMMGGRWRTCWSPIGH